MKNKSAINDYIVILAKPTIRKLENVNITWIVV